MDINMTLFLKTLAILISVIYVLFSESKIIKKINY